MTETHSEQSNREEATDPAVYSLSPPCLGELSGRRHFLITHLSDLSVMENAVSALTKELGSELTSGKYIPPFGGPLGRAVNQALSSLDPLRVAAAALIAIDLKIVDTRITLATLSPLVSSSSSYEVPALLRLHACLATLTTLATDISPSTDARDQLLCSHVSQFLALAESIHDEREQDPCSERAARQLATERIEPIREALLKIAEKDPRQANPFLWQGLLYAFSMDQENPPSGDQMSRLTRIADVGICGSGKLSATELGFATVCVCEIFKRLNDPPETFSKLLEKIWISSAAGNLSISDDVIQHLVSPWFAAHPRPSSLLNRAANDLVASADALYTHHHQSTTGKIESIACLLCHLFDSLKSQAAIEDWELFLPCIEAGLQRYKERTVEIPARSVEADLWVYIGSLPAEYHSISRD